MNATSRQWEAAKIIIDSKPLTGTRDAQLKALIPVMDRIMRYLQNEISSDLWEDLPEIKATNFKPEDKLPVKVDRLKKAINTLCQVGARPRRINTSSDYIEKETIAGVANWIETVVDPLLLEPAPTNAAAISSTYKSILVTGAKISAVAVVTTVGLVGYIAGKHYYQSQ